MQNLLGKQIFHFKKVEGRRSTLRRREKQEINEDSVSTEIEIEIKPEPVVEEEDDNFDWGDDVREDFMENDPLQLDDLKTDDAAPCSSGMDQGSEEVEVNMKSAAAIALGLRPRLNEKAVV